MRISVFCSNRHIYAQLIDDKKGKTLVSASDFEIKDIKDRKKIAFDVGKLLAQKAKKAKVAIVVFDRGHYKYHGIVRAIAEGAREGGLKF